MTRDYLSVDDLDVSEIIHLLDVAAQMKTDRSLHREALAGKTVALIFEKASTRTRVSFEVGVAQLGGAAIVLRSDELQLTRGESVRDTAIVLSRYVDCIVARLGDHGLIEELAAHAGVPVINALTPLHHPCQVLADLATLEERFGRLDDLKLAYVGDGNNVCNSLMLLGSRAGVQVAVATPSDLRPSPEIVRAAGDGVELTDDPETAVRGADALYTDVWVSMGDEQEARKRREVLAPYQLNEQLLAAAGNGAIVMHCLPAHPGEEITEGLLYGEQSAVWDQAENRLHAQKALLELLLSDR
jgi:ornithine carbamoyltransferase